MKPDDRYMVRGCCDSCKHQIPRANIDAASEQECDFTDVRMMSIGTTVLTKLLNNAIIKRENKFLRTSIL